MSITAMADRLVTVLRRTSLVLDPAQAVASSPATRQPGAAASIRIRLTGGTSTTGTVTVTGTVDGVPGTSETLTFTGPDVQGTVKRYTAISAITTTGLADEVTPPTLQADAVGRDGAPIVSEYTLVSAWLMRKDAGAASWPAPVPGSTQSEETRFYLDYSSTWTPREGDVFIDDRTSEQWQVIGHPAQHGGGQTVPHHYEVRVRRREGSATT